MAPHIEIYYANIERLADYFRQHQAKVTAIQRRLESQIEVLSRSGWQSSAATKFYTDCTPVLAGIGRLSSALGSSAETLERIAALFLEAEQAGADAIPTPPGFVALSAKVPTRAGKVTGAVQQAVEPTPIAPPDPSQGVTATPAPGAGAPPLPPTLSPVQTPEDHHTPTAQPTQAPSDQEPSFRYPYSPPSHAAESPHYEFGVTMNEMAPLAYELAMADGPLPLGDAGGTALMLAALATDILMVLGLLSAVTPPPREDADAEPQSSEPVAQSNSAESSADQSQSPGYTDGSGYRTAPETGERVLDPQNLPANPDDLLEHGWVETTHPNARENGRRTFTDPATGNRVVFDAEQEGQTGHRGHDHYHVYNPNGHGRDFTLYLDRNGNPVARNSEDSHIYPEGDL